jgi:hypothetical protein
MELPRQLRLIQAGLVVFTLACFIIERLGVMPVRQGFSTLQWIAIIGGLWCAVAGFSGQRRISRGAGRTQNQLTASKRPARWKTGHVVRLANAFAVGQWGLLLHYTGAPQWLPDFFLGLSLLLLLIWKPGAVPLDVQP